MSGFIFFCKKDFLLKKLNAVVADILKQQTGQTDPSYWKTTIRGPPGN